MIKEQAKKIVRTRSSVAETSAFGPLFRGFSHTVNHLGTSHFEDRLLDAVNSCVSIDFLVIFIYRENGEIRALGQASRRDISSVRSFTRDYIDKFFPFDPNAADFHHLPHNKRVIFRRHDPARIQNSRYRKKYYDAKLIDKVSYLWWADGISYYVNLYRTPQQQRFTPAELLILQDLTPMVSSLVSAHGRLLKFDRKAWSGNVSAVADDVVALIGPELSEREREVMARILMGLETEGIALDLGLKASSVITFRKRAYVKLGITNQAELFALALRTVL